MAPTLFLHMFLTLAFFNLFFTFYETNVEHGKKWLVAQIGWEKVGNMLESLDQLEKELSLMKSVADTLKKVLSRSLPVVKLLV